MSRPFPTGAIKLSRDLSSLVNNPSGSDVRFLVGAGDSPVYIYAHSAVLRCRSRYFAAMFEDEGEWRERSSGIIRKPNVSPAVFQAVLWYIYTGGVEMVEWGRILEMIAAAEEMELEELSFECQSRVMEILTKAVVEEEEEEVNKEGESDSTFAPSPAPGFTSPPEMDSLNNCKRLPVALGIRMLLIPALVLAYQHALAEFFQQLLDYTLTHIPTILASPETHAAFLDTVPLQIIKQVLASNSLALQEFKIWDLALEWACHQTKVLKPAVESQLRLNRANQDKDLSEEDSEGEDDEEAVTTKVIEAPSHAGMEAHSVTEDHPLVSDRELKTLKMTLAPLLSAIRFTLLAPEIYARVAETLSYFLPKRRLVELQRFFSPSEQSIQSEVPRIAVQDRGVQEDVWSNIVDRESWMRVKTWIFESNALENCQALGDIRFTLLFRASEHKFKVSAFHEYCDDKGPTLVLVKSVGNYLFGGVNFADWTTGERYTQSRKNFLFALKDGYYRHEPALFKINLSRAANAAYNHIRCGPVFGGFPHDLHIYDPDFPDNLPNASSNLPNAYYGEGANNTALAGSKLFKLADYEVFALTTRGSGRHAGRV